MPFEQTTGEAMASRLLMQLAFALAVLVPVSAHAAKGSVPYEPQAVQAALERGCAVLLEFAAPW